MTLRHLSALALVGATSLTFGACGTATVNIENLQNGMAEQIKKDTGAKDVKVTCPEEVEAKAGGTFECDVDADGNKATFTITQKDDQGNVRWDLKQ